MYFGCKTDQEREREQFLELSRVQRNVEILKKPLAEQVELFMMVMEKTHHEDFALVEALASNGSDLIPHLLERLHVEKSAVSKCHLLQVFWIMQRGSYYDVASDSRLVKELEQEIASIGEDTMRERGERYLRDIRLGTVWTR